MANVDTPRGLWPIMHKGGHCRLTAYEVTAGNAVGIGDPLYQAAGTDTVVIAAASQEIVGVAQSCVGTADTDRTVLVADDPDQLFGIQCDATLAETHRGQYADILATASGTYDAGYDPKRANTLIYSKVELRFSTLHNSANQLQIIDRIKFPDNAWGANVNVVVKIDEHKYAGT